MTECIKKKYYVNNKQLLPLMRDYRELYVDWVESGKIEGNKPTLSTEASEMIIKICTRVSFSRSFINYPYREEMVNDAIYNSLRYAHNFNHLKSENPFGYFSSIAHNACKNRINIEKAAYYTKAKYVQSMALDDSMNHIFDNELSNDSTDTNDFVDFLKEFYDIDLVEYDQKLQERKDLKKKNNKDNEDKPKEKVVGGLFDFFDEEGNVLWKNY